MKRLLNRKIHWSWSGFVIFGCLVIAGTLVLAAINNANNIHKVTELAIDYHDDLAARTFADHEKEIETEVKKNDDNNDNDEQQATTKQTQSKPEPEQEELTWCGDGKEGRQNRFGWSEYHVCKRRAEVGKPLPTDWSALAQTFLKLAQEEDYQVDQVPSKYSILYKSYQPGSWHVGFVEKLNPDGSIEVSEMNHIGDDGEGGWGLISERTISKNNLAIYQFVD